MKKIIIISLGIILSIIPLQSQETLDDVINVFNNKTIPYISVTELAMPLTDAIILDTREPIEYQTSHIKHAVLVGYDKFNIDSVSQILPNKNSKIVVYCSLGIRSERIGEKLKKAGYKNVLNLYGGIFEWKNKGFPVYNSDNQETENIHVNNKHWGKWLLKGKKIYD
jgi:rhodanese-related sulfurtransferase